MSIVKGFSSASTAVASTSGSNNERVIMLNRNPSALRHESYFLMPAIAAAYLGLVESQSCEARAFADRIILR